MALTPARRAVVVGGGLAGIAAALDLGRAGIEVVVVEQRPFLGGRAFSFEDPESGATIDNGQHVLVGACTRLRALLERIGAPTGAFVRQSRLEVPILDPEGRVARLRAAPLPAPFHVAPSLLAYRHLGGRDRATTIAALRRLATLPAAELADLDPVSLGTWLGGRGVGGEAIRRFWDPIVRPALNVPADHANVPLTALFLREAVWRGPTGGALWLPRVGLSEALGGPAAAALGRAGIDVRAGVRAVGVDVVAGRIAGVRTSAGDVEADAVVVAVPPRPADDLVPAEAAGPEPFSRVGASPIVNVYLWYDRPVADRPFAGTFGLGLQWVFDRRRLLGDGAGGECVGVSLSAADDAIEADKDALADRCDEALGRLFPRRRAARRLRHAVVKEPRGTFRAGPRLAGRRPGSATPVAGLALAGDWTDTGWPATMEGAVRSGEAAARALLVASRRSPVDP